MGYVNKINCNTYKECVIELDRGNSIVYRGKGKYKGCEIGAHPSWVGRATVKDVKKSLARFQDWQPTI